MISIDIDVVLIVYDSIFFCFLQEVKKKKFLEEQQPYFMEKFDTILKENQEGDGYFVGDEVSK